MSELMNPEKVFAIVVGIEKYAGIAGLDGPANDALRFIKWLRKLNVPPQHIITHIAEIDKNVTDCNNQLTNLNIPEDNQFGATYTEIRDSLLNAPNNSNGDLLYLFWGGHGMYSYKHEQQFLFVSDAKINDYQGIGADDLVTFLSQKKYKEHSYKDRFILIDACVDEQRKDINETKMPLQGGKNKIGASIADINIALIQSADLGQVAEQESDNEKRTGVCSNILLDWLKCKENRKLKPDIKNLIEHIKSEFKIKEIVQRPIFLKVGNWDSETEIIINELSDSERMRRLYTVKELLRLMNCIDITTNELKRFYYLTLSDDPRLYEEQELELELMLSVLSEKQQRDGINIDREIEFIWRIATEKQIETIIYWVKQKTTTQKLADLNELIQTEKGYNNQQKNYLVIDIPDSDLAGEKHIIYWFYSNKPVLERGVINYPHDTNNTDHSIPDEIRKKILELISEKQNHLHGKLFVEVYLTQAYLNHGVEEWECPSYLDDNPLLGEVYPTVVRWRERATCNDNRTHYGAWGQRAKNIRDVKYCPQPKNHWVELSNEKPRELMTSLLNSNYGETTVGFAFSPPNQLILGALLSGAPFIFWRRTDFSNRKEFKNSLNAISGQGQLNDFPLGIRKFREESLRRIEHHGHSLTLLWDDPQRNPLGEKFSNETLNDLASSKQENTQ